MKLMKKNKKRKMKGRQDRYGNISSKTKMAQNILETQI